MNILAAVTGNCDGCADPWLPGGTYQQTVWTIGGREHHGQWCAIELESLPQNDLPRYRSSQVFQTQPVSGLVYYIPWSDEDGLQVVVESDHA